MPKRERLARRDAAGRDRPARGARHHRVDVGVVPHVERAGGAGADRDAEQRDEAEHRMQVPGRDHQPDQRREHHERHHPRLHQREIVADAGEARLGAAVRATGPAAGAFADSDIATASRDRASSFAPAAPHLMRGSSRTGGTAAARAASTRAWSRPAPTDCRAACSLRMKASATPIEEDQDAEAGDVGADRGDVVPAGERVRIVGDSGAACRPGPRKCCGKKTRLTPTKVSQKCSLPIVS